MRWFLLLPMLLILSLDFVTLDAPLVPQGSRQVEADDEEESVPSRTLRVRREKPPATATLPAHRYVAPPQARRPLASVSGPAQRSDPPPWVGPITQTRFASLGSVSPPEDH